MRIFGFLLLLCSACHFIQEDKQVVQSGDLLFQDLDCGPLCDAIEKVTHGYKGRSFSHIGLVYVRNDSAYVVEAVGKDVHLTPLTSFLSRSTDSSGKPKVMQGRLKEEHRHLIEPAIAFALKQLGVPYDDAFIYDNGSYYCSELIYDAFREGNAGKDFFELEPMTFKNPEDGKTFPAWEEYYQSLDFEIPEGQPGCNPAGISRSDKLIVGEWKTD